MESTATREDVLTLIRQDHETIADLFEELESVSEVELAAQFEKLKVELLMHAHAEESSVYPFLEMTRDTKGVAKDYIADHGKIHRLIVRLDTALEEGAILLREDFRGLRQAVDAHVEEEEQELIPELKVLCSHAELEDLAVEYGSGKERYRAKLKPAA